MNKDGMNWIRQEKRLAIYLRDGLACVYCDRTIEDGIALDADHLIPRVDGGSNDADNVVTSCSTCNNQKGDRAVRRFVAAVAKYRNVPPKAIMDHIRRCTARPLDVAAAKEMIARRGSAAKAVKHLKSK